MLFDSFIYWIFFGAVVLTLSALRPTQGKWLLVIASYVFYACWDVRFVVLLGVSTLANWVFGLWIERSAGNAAKHALAAAIVFNLGTLAFFKYFNFFSASLAALLHLDPHGFMLHIILPVGISFFTFEGIAYAVDVYRRDLAARRDALDFALFISFFPHLIAGPIIRPVNFFPQINRPLVLDAQDSRWGLREILKGLFKKLALANYFAPFADAYFHAAPGNAQLIPAWIGVLAFSMQIYFDFSGYTDIARGCARLLGFKFPANFERPYLATNIADFWRRWHISLSTWLRDYLYIPLGGNRHGELRTCANLTVVMGLGGLWHGASWNFAAWGLLHGCALVVHRYWRRCIDTTVIARVADHELVRPIWIALTFAFVTLAWIPFRSPDLATTLATFKTLFLTPDFHLLAIYPGLLLIPALTLIFCIWDRNRRVQDWFVARASFAHTVAAGVSAIIALELFARVDTTIPFVYFQF